MSGIAADMQVMRWERESLDYKISLNQLTDMMRSNSMDSLILWTLDGSVEEESSLLWQGMAYMDLYLWVYDLEDGKAIERDRFVLTGERLQFKIWR